jgi:hypothetical protein
VKEGVAYSRAQHWPDVEVRTWLIAQPSGHVRIHHLRTGRKLTALEGGFAVTWVTFEATKAELNETAVIRAPHGASALRNLFSERKAERVDLGANSHLLSTLSSMPALRSTHEPGEHWLACWAGGAETSDEFRQAVEFSIAFDGAECRLLRNGELWWSTQGGPCGTSSPARLKSLEQSA